MSSITARRTLDASRMTLDVPKWRRSANFRPAYDWWNAVIDPVTTIDGIQCKLLSIKRFIEIPPIAGLTGC